MSAIEVELNPFSIGTCFQKSFKVCGQAFLPILLVTASASVPDLILQLITPAIRVFGVLYFGIFSFTVGIFGFILQIAIQGIIVFGTFRVLQGKSFDVGGAFRQAFRKVGTLAGLSIVLGLLIGLASLALLIPGVIVGTVYAVAVPACVIESTGVSESLRRSRTLTKGNRWKVFGIYALVMIVMFVIFSAIMGSLFFLIRPTAVDLVGIRFQMVSPILNFVIRLISVGFLSVVISVIYSELRYAKEGVGIDEIVDVFA